MTTQTKATTHAADCWSWGPAHYACALREMGRLVAELREMNIERLRLREELDGLQEGMRALLDERDALREALAALITWIPSADTYRRLGFDPEAPMRALEDAKKSVEK